MINSNCNNITITVNNINTVIGIDPDVEKSGIAILDCDTKTIDVLQSLAFPDLLDTLRSIQRQQEVQNKTYRVIIEAGWLNKAHWHILTKDNKRLAAAKGNSAGRNHEIGRKIAEMCKHWQIPYELIKPLQLRFKGVNIWKGKDGKITHEELAAFIPLKINRTNQEERDAALIAWTWAGFSMKKRKK